MAASGMISSPEPFLAPSSQRPSPFPRPSPSPAPSGLLQESVRGPATSKSSLLSLPPRRRAEALLLDMAGLCGRILELTRGSQAEGRAVSSFSQKQGVGQQFLAGAVVPPEGRSATGVRELLSILEAHQSLLSESIAEVQELQGGKRERAHLISRTSETSAALRQFAKRLRDSQLLLEGTLDDYQEYKHLRKRKSTEETTVERSEGSHGSPVQSDLDTQEKECSGRSTVDVQDLIAYAHKISYTTFAPPEFAQGLGLMGVLPPAPQDEQMRASALYHFTDEELGVPKPPEPSADEPTSEAKEALIAPKQESGFPPPPSMAAGGPPSASLTTSIKKEGAAPLPPPPPPGWKPGDPITLPPPPPGWKPGDPIPLPPMAGHPTAAPPGHPAGAPRPAGPPAAPSFQVRHVELDLNPELEDSDSDYSGSSDEED